MQAIIVSPDSVGGLAIGQRPEPTPDSTQALVAVHAVSLNRGEVRRAATMEAGSAIGWDLAGVVATAAADGTGPQAGQRVVGLSLGMQGWAERVAVDARALAVVPDAVSLEMAATLPVAGLTALYGLERCSRLLGARVVITGATGGVGYFACQLAILMGARVVAQVRRNTHAALLEALDLEAVIVDVHGDRIAAQGPFRLVLDGVGGPLLGRLVSALDRDGQAVVYGVSDTAETQFSARDLMFTGAGRIDGFHLYRESEIVPAGLGLARLLALVADGRLQTCVSRVEDWSAAGEVAAALVERSYPGKAVLRVTGA